VTDCSWQALSPNLREDNRKEVVVMSCVDVELTDGVSGMRRLLARLNRWWQANQERRRQQITAAALYSLDDRTLNDIGIDRSEIEFLFNSNDRLRSYGRF
jgi:uncharacterized protein YjiS (DUF1127 family)